jgi:putative protease
LRRSLAENLAAARAQARPTLRKTIVPNDAPFPETTLDFRANVLNERARAFYRRHQVREIEAAAESGSPMAGRVVMTCRYCLKYELLLCPRTTKPTSVLSAPSVPSSAKIAIPSPPDPWFLVDDEGRRLRLRFRCDARDCVMDIVYEG